MHDILQTMVDPMAMTAVDAYFALACLLAVICAFLSFFYTFLYIPKKKVTKVEASPLPTKPETVKKNKNFKCPFSAESSFIIESADGLKQTPLDLYGDWEDNLASRWLAAGLSGQDTPGMLRMGLNRMRNFDNFLVETPHQFCKELLMKKEALDDPVRHKIVYAQELESIPAQAETLELLMAYLPQRYPTMYTYDAKENSITVHPLGDTFKLNDWAHAPLELCERIVQEDLCLMRPGDQFSKDKLAKEGYYMAAAAVVFSFNELQEKLGKPAEIIHAPVPGYERHLRKGLNLFFNRLKPEAPHWRNNWGIGPSGALDEPLYGSISAMKNRVVENVTREDVRTRFFLTVEYQTIMRLPRSGYLLFTIRTFKDPLSC